MNGLVNYLRGNAKVEIYGAYPEQFINNLAKRGLPFWKFSKTAKSVAEVYIPYYFAGDAQKLCKGTDCEIRIIKIRGLPVFLRRLRLRFALIIGLILCVISLPVLSLFVWEFEVSGNRSVSSGEIMSVLEDLGVHRGMFGLSIDQEYIRSRALYELKDLSWLTVNIVGTKAEVIVRERIKKPEIIDEKTPAYIVANKNGVITDINVFQGAAQVTLGQTVAEGDVLISAEVPSLKSDTRIVHALGEIYARTWYDFSYEMPLKYNAKIHTGKVSKKSALILFDKRINLYFNAGLSNTFCDKIIKTKRIGLPRGFTLPLAISTDTYTEYINETCVMNVQEAEELLKRRLVEHLEEQIGDGENTSAEFETEVSQDIIKVTIHAECLEQIGQLRQQNEKGILFTDDRKNP